MKRILLLAVLAICGSQSSAAELKGVFKSGDKAKNTITVAVDGRDATYAMSKDASIVSVRTVKGKKNKTAEEVKTLDGLDAVKPGSQVTFLTDKQDEQEVVSSVKVNDDTHPADAKKKKKKPADAKKNKKKNAT